MKFGNEKPSREEMKRMFCKAVRIMIERTMKLHDYVYDGRIIRQREGGSIGLDLTGVVADIYMGHWDQRYREKLSNQNIICKLYKRYKDDINLVVQDLNEERTDRKEKERSILSRCMKLADSIHPSIKVTGDAPSNYKDNKLPILDLKVWIEEVNPDSYKIITSHYMKDVSTRAVININSSHSLQMKKNVMVNEILRILRNCNEFYPWKEVTKHISYFMQRLQFFGYDKKLRYEIIRTALKKHRSKKLERKESTNESIEMKNKQKWFLKGDNKPDAVMFVPATRNGELKKEIQRAAEKNKMKLKVVEKVESSVHSELQRSNPFKSSLCRKEKCVVCKLGSNVNCRARGCVYEMICDECGRRYRGQTGNSLQERINQHFEDWRRGQDTSPLHKHGLMYHQGNTFPVTVKILKNCQSDPTTRKITEAVLIDELSPAEMMNSKCEWTYVKLNKISTRY